MINGVQYSWEGKTVKMPHGTLIDITNLTYKDSRPVNRLRGKGSRTRGYSRGPYEAEGTVEMRREEYERMAASYPNGVYDGKPVPITASYAKDGGPTITDTLESCLFDEREFGSKVDDESEMVKLNITILGDVLVNGKRPFRAD